MVFMAKIVLIWAQHRLTGALMQAAAGGAGALVREVLCYQEVGLYRPFSSGSKGPYRLGDQPHPNPPDWLEIVKEMGWLERPGAKRGEEREDKLSSMELSKALPGLKGLPAPAKKRL